MYGDYDWLVSRDGRKKENQQHAAPSGGWHAVSTPPFPSNFQIKVAHY